MENGTLMDLIALCIPIVEEVCSPFPFEQITKWLTGTNRRKKLFWCIQWRGCYTDMLVRCEEDNFNWVDYYNETLFFRLFRMQKATFLKLFNAILRRDNYGLVKKKYRGGNFPVNPETSLLVFLWYIAKEDSLQSTATVFKIAVSTVMRIVNVFLYFVIKMKKEYIFWPETPDEFEHIANGFHQYPGAIGAVDGSHIEIKVPSNQHDSYCNRYQYYSVNVMGIATSQKVFIYIFVGFPGAAHDSRVFSNSLFVQNIERFGSQIYFPNEDQHIIGDSAFPIRRWLLVPYRKTANLNRVQKYHNYRLSSARIAIENVFGLVKGRWRRLLYVNTFSISKAIEIITAACILHNFCYMANDEWTGEIIHDVWQVNQIVDNNLQEVQLGKAKRDRIAHMLFHQR